MFGIKHKHLPNVEVHFLCNKLSFCKSYTACLNIVWELNCNSFFSFRPLQKYVGKFYKEWMRIIKLVWCEFSMNYSTDGFPISYRHFNIPLELQGKHWTHCNGLNIAVLHYVGEMSVMISLKFYIISKYFPIVSEWLCSCFHLFF